MNSQVVGAIAGRIDTALGDVPLYFREQGGSSDSIQGARPAPPYALFQQVTRPGDPSKFDAAEIVALMLWAGEREIRGILEGLEEIDGLWIPRVESAGVAVAVNVRCKLQSRVGPQPEPEARMPPPMESYALWKSVGTYRITYMNLVGASQSWEAVV